jgi:branched-chain amino acid aminotransferase
MKTAPAARTGFGTRMTPTCFLQRYRGGAWERGSFDEAAPLALAPLAHALHYGASIFEGFKAHRQPDGRPALFRARDHLARLNHSAERMCLPQVDVEELCQAIVELVRRDAAQVPAPPDALYVRPLMFADDAVLGYSTPSSVTLVVMLVPVPALFKGNAGVRLCTETRYVRAAPGGTGSAKCAGNYAGALLAQREARARGFDEVLWLDACERRFVEEAGGMNLMLVRGGKLSTPPLSDTILPGITRDSLLALARAAGVPAEERRISTDPEDWREVSEAFSSGTAAGTAHIREIVHEGRVLFARSAPGPLARQLGERLERIKLGLEPDPFGWRLAVE